MHLSTRKFALIFKKICICLQESLHISVRKVAFVYMQENLHISARQFAHICKKICIYLQENLHIFARKCTHSARKLALICKKIFPIKFARKVLASPIEVYGQAMCRFCVCICICEIVFLTTLLLFYSHPCNKLFKCTVSRSFKVLKDFLYI